MTKKPYLLIVDTVQKGEDAVRTTVIPVMGATESEALKTFLSEKKGTNTKENEVGELLNIVQQLHQNWHTFANVNITRFEWSFTSNTGNANMTLATAEVYFKHVK